ncbi:MAG: hypothetical protein WCG85_17455 [Polyangia bacterium]
MPATEDSVLTSLDELRRLRKERRKKGHASGGPGGNGRSHKHAGAAHDPTGDQVTPPPRSDFSSAARGARAGGQPVMGGAAWASPVAQAQAAPVAATWDAPVDPMALARMARPTSSAKPAIVVAVLLLAGAGIGYLKLQSDTQAMLADKDASIRRVEDARAQAVEAAAKAERQAQAKLKACEAKAASVPGTTAAASVAPAASAAVAPAPSVSYPPASSRGRHRPSGRHAAAAAPAPAPSASPTAVPQLPHKKKLDNDPLAGIKI